ncbi:MAG: PD-(D/E)XK nuclease family protein [Planctomycetota bacterium]
MAIVHELSWSTSRARTFAACKRRYYFDYYLSWLGWGRNADPERRRAYLLKKMTRMPMLTGDIVHRAIAEFFARRDQGLGWTSEEARAWAVTELRRGYKTSRDGAWKARPAKSVRLAEHHYEEADIDESTGAAGDYGKRFVDRIGRCLDEFFTGQELAEARASEPRDWLACEDMSTFELFDTKVFAVPDFAYLAPSESAERTVRILDWKTGRPSPADAFQLEVYAFYARERWEVDPARTRAADVYLLDGAIAEVTVDGDVLEAALARIESSIGEMRAVHFDADRSKGDSEAFPMVPEAESGRECPRCNYRELCGRT